MRAIAIAKIMNFKLNYSAFAPLRQKRHGDLRCTFTWSNSWHIAFSASKGVQQCNTFFKGGSPTMMAEIQKASTKLHNSKVL